MKISVKSYPNLNLIISNSCRCIIEIRLFWITSMQHWNFIILNSGRCATEIWLFQIQSDAIRKFDYLSSQARHWNPAISDPCRRHIEIQLFLIHIGDATLRSDYFRIHVHHWNPAISSSLKSGYFEFTPTIKIRLFRIHINQWDSAISNSRLSLKSGYFEFTPTTEIWLFWVHASVTLPTPPDKALSVTISGRNCQHKNSTKVQKKG